MERAEVRGETSGAFGELVGQIASTDVEVYKRLNASNDKEAKAEFVERPELVHPRNEYGNLDAEEVRRNLGTLDMVEEQLVGAGLSDKRQRLVGLLVEDCRRKNVFLAANLAYNDATTEEEKAQAAEFHRQANEALYGRPDEQTFYTLLNEQLAQIKVEELSEEDRALYDRMMEQIGPIEQPEGGRFKPRPETVERFAELTEHFFGGFLAHIPDGQEEFSSEEVVGILNEILETEFGEGEVPYRAVVDEKASNADASHEQRLINFPPGKTYSRAKVKGLMVHELGTHVMRAIPYMDSEIRAFSTGLPGNETFDEGIAKCVEQAINGRYEDSGIDHYINIGLATFKGKNFREVYDIQMALKHLTGKNSGTVLNAVQRCFRGTGEMPNNKDLAYYNGANQVWEYIDEHLDDPELFDDLFLTGKANIGNPVQEALVYEMRTGAGL